MRDGRPKNIRLARDDDGMRDGRPIADNPMRDGLREYIRLARPQNIASESGDITYRSPILTRKRMAIPEISIRLGAANHPSSENTFAITDKMQPAHQPRHMPARAISEYGRTSTDPIPQERG